MEYYDIHWSNERMITGLGEAAEYDICRMIVGIHRAHSVFLSKPDIQKNEKSDKYRQQIISETIEKIKLRPYSSIYFRKKIFFQGEEFLYYPLPYNLFAMCVKMGELLKSDTKINAWPLYYGVMYHGISALSLLEDNLLGSAYPLCRSAFEIYLKLLIQNAYPELHKWHEKFSNFEIEQSCCSQTYPKEFLTLFQKRICQTSKSKAAYLHFGWVDFIDGYHNVVKKSPYSVYGLLTFLKNDDKNFELEQQEKLYKSCHAYTHGSVQTAKYPLLHYFEISIMLYYIIRKTFLLLCDIRKEKPLINGIDIITKIDRDFKLLHDQYTIRSTENFERGL